MVCKIIRARCCMLLSLGFLVSCGGGGESPVNLSVDALTVNSDFPEISYPLDMTVRLSSDKALSESSVSIFVMEKSESEDANVRQIPLGTEIITPVTAGTSDYQFVLNIPASVEIPGDYFLAALVDPTDEVIETDEEDNIVFEEIAIAPPLIPNLFIEELELDRNALEINTGSFEDLVNLVENNVYNADAAATVTIGVDGLRDGETMGVEAFSVLRMSRSDVGTSHDVSLYLWRSDESRYINAYGVDPSGVSSAGLQEWLPLGALQAQQVETDGDTVVIDDVVRDSSYMNFYFPGKLGSELAYEMRYGHIDTTFALAAAAPSLPPPDLTTQAILELKAFLANLPSNGIAGDESDAMAVTSFEICVAVRPLDAGITETNAADNEACKALLITLPPEESTILPPVNLDGYESEFSRPSGPLGTGTSYRTAGGGSAFGFELDFGSFATADNRGYREGIHGDIPITIFGFDYSFFKLDVDAQLVPDYVGKSPDENSRFRIEFRHAGQLLTRIVEIPTNTQISVGLDQLSVSKELPDPEKGGIAESTIFVGPIPLSAGAYVSGNIGFNITPFVFTNTSPASHKLGIEAGPFANIEALMYAGVGSRRLPVLVGVEGVLSLLDGQFVLFNGVDIEEMASQPPSTHQEFVIRQGPKGTVIFTGPQGRLNLFAQFTVPKINTCKIGLIKIPCPGFAKVKATKNIWSSPALFRFKDVLFDVSNAEISVVIREGAQPLYFQP